MRFIHFIFMPLTENQKIIQELKESLNSGEYQKRLSKIHQHYPNLKSEGRYRDALLEVFNEKQFKDQSEWRAYAEVNKVDMVITKSNANPVERLHIEFKYHFTYDIAHRVSKALTCLLKTTTYDDFFKRGECEKKGDLGGILKDCLTSKFSDKSCDLFILIIQDRSRLLSAEKNFSCLTKTGQHWLNERGISINFLNEQIVFDRMFMDNPDSYTNVWINAAINMFRYIYIRRPFNVFTCVRHVVTDYSNEHPLISHLIGLDFSNEKIFSQDINVEKRNAFWESDVEPGFRTSLIENTKM